MQDSPPCFMGTYYITDIFNRLHTLTTRDQISAYLTYKHLLPGIDRHPYSAQQGEKKTRNLLTLDIITS